MTTDLPASVEPGGHGSGTFDHGQRDDG